MKSNLPYFHKQNGKPLHGHVEDLEDYLSEVLLELPQWRRAWLKRSNNWTMKQSA